MKIRNRFKTGKPLGGCKARSAATKNMVNYFRRLLDINDRAAGLRKGAGPPVHIGCMNYTYIVKCRDGTLYTGWTNDLEKRIRDHNCGRGAKYTKSRRPVELIYYEGFPTKKEAMRREWEIKQLSAQEKQKLMEIV